MAGDLSYTVTLADGISAPAKNAGKELQNLGRMMAAARVEDERLTRQLGLMQLAAQAEDVKRTSAAWEASEDSIAGFTGGLIKAGEAAVVLGVVISGLGYETLKFAAEATEAKNRAIVLFDAMGDGSAGAGQRTLDMIDDLTQRLPQSRKELVAYTKDFEAMGITDLSQLQGQLLAVSSAQALVRDGGAEAYETLTRKIQAFIETGQGLKLPLKGLGSLAKVGVDVNAVAKQMGLSAKVLEQQLKAGTANAAKFGEALQTALVLKGKGPLASLGSEFGTVVTKGIESFEKLFDEIDFKPLINGLRAFFAIFDDSDDAGKALKGGITTGLNGLVLGLADVEEKVEFFFLTIENYALRNRKELGDLWEDAKIGGRAFLFIVEKIAGALSHSVGLAMQLAGAMSADKGAHVNTPEEVDALRAARGETVSTPAFKRAPAHAEGGTVMQPAAGEMFASVAPGERIVPKGGGDGVSIESVTLHITAPHGVTDAADISAHALALALERYQLSVGR